MQKKIIEIQQRITRLPETYLKNDVQPDVSLHSPHGDMRLKAVKNIFELIEMGYTDNPAVYKALSSLVFTAGDRECDTKTYVLAQSAIELIGMPKDQNVINAMHQAYWDSFNLDYKGTTVMVKDVVTGQPTTRVLNKPCGICYSEDTGAHGHQNHWAAHVFVLKSLAKDLNNYKMITDMIKYSTRILLPETYNVKKLANIFQQTIGSINNEEDKFTRDKYRVSNMAIMFLLAQNQKPGVLKQLKNNDQFLSEALDILTAEAEDPSGDRAQIVRIKKMLRYLSGHSEIGERINLLSRGKVTKEKMEFLNSISNHRDWGSWAQKAINWLEGN
ncbi:MAG: hypothetical protein ABIH39_07620 [Candidatus Margulisiibacteriota bacterium]